MFAWQATVQDEFGNAITLPVVTVYEHDGVTLADIFDEAGDPLANPLTGTLEGFVQFWADAGRYVISGASGGDTTEDWVVDLSSRDTFATRAAFIAANIPAAQVRSSFIVADRAYSVVRKTGGAIVQANGQAWAYDLGLTKPPAIIVMSGQSNAVSSNAQSAGGTLTPDTRIKFWNGSAFVTMDPANGVGVPVAGRNSIAFQAARAAIADGHPEVFVIINGQAGTPISGWVGSGTSSAQYVSLKSAVDAAISASGYSKVTHFIWAQGESDGGPSVNVTGYRDAFETLKAQLRAEVWFDAETPITAMEMPPQGAASTLNMFFLGVIPFDLDPYTVTTRTQGLDAGADTLHWTGNSIDIIGLRAWLNLSGRGKQALAAPGVLRHPTPFLQMDPVFGKGLVFQYQESLDQFNMGAASDASYPAINTAFISFDVNDSWVRLDANAFSLKKHEFLSSAILKKFFGSHFADITHPVNTTDKVQGAMYYDSVNNRLMIARGPDPGDGWSRIDATAVVTPT